MKICQIEKKTIPKSGGWQQQKKKMVGQEVGDHTSLPSTTLACVELANVLIIIDVTETSALNFHIDPLMSMLTLTRAPAKQAINMFDWSELALTGPGSAGLNI